MHGDGSIKNFDVIIIGGGVAGIGAAAMLAKNSSVVVLEAESQCGYHASGRSAAIYIPSYGCREICELTAASESYYLAGNDFTDGRSFLSPRGMLSFAAAGEEDAFDDHLADSSEAGELSVDEALKLVPILRRDKVSRAAVEESARDIDTDLLMQSWIKLCRLLGGDIITGRPVSSMMRDSDNWIVKTAEQRYCAPIVINAAGAWADQVASMAAVAPLGLKPCRRSAALIPAPAGYDVGRWPLFAPIPESWYVKPMAGKLMLSPADEDAVEAHDAFAEDMTILEAIDRYEKAVTVTVERVESSWAGLRTFAADRVPVVGWEPCETGFFWLAGQGGYGFQTAPAISQLVSKLVLGQSLENSEQALVEGLSPSRFRQDQII